MSTKGGKIRGHLFHGDPKRFEVLADYIYQCFGNKIKTIADVAGGQGMLSRILKKKYNYDSEVVDTRKYVLLGVKHRQAEYVAQMADYYDLVVGLHPDQATRPVVESAIVTRTLLIPCCNFWDQSRKLGREAMLAEIEEYYDTHKIKWERVVFDFEGPKNVGLITNDYA